MITRRGVLKLLGAGLMAGLAAVAYPFVEVFGRPRITRYAFTPRNWTPGLNLRIAVIADLHACEPWMDAARIEGICGDAQALGADLILLLGDYITGMDRAADEIPASDWATALARLSAPLGLHAIAGNHDYWEDDRFQRGETSEPAALEALRNAGIPVYRNQSIRLEKDGHAFWLAGLDDQLAFLPGSRYGRARLSGLDDIDATLATVTDSAPILLMAHEPDAFAFGVVPDRVSLTLSGHTHGGQISLFGWRPWAASAGSRHYPAGYYNVDGRELIVSRGLGCSVVPVRLGNWPEVVLLELGA
ncbi:metallophosphoesterase [Devosia lacusdianchii]|uniref:metallophosphoesterase n=1 Tax=Devosia lacusdianchii TaxID=2917991 RepID=UPI001F06055E|nr:metallophosphoesterase [Devosia sp. JXJ CY 41]